MADSLHKSLNIKELYLLNKQVYRSFSKRIKFFPKLLIYRTYISEMYIFFTQVIKMPISKYNPRIYGKIFQPYIFCGLLMHKKMQYLMGHYAYIQNNFSEDFIRTIYLDKSSNLLLGKIDYDENKTLSVMLYKPSPGFMKEGELSLMLMDDATQISVFSSTFIFNSENNISRIIIGRIQGVPSRYEHGDVIIKALTKKLHGLRPSALIMFIFQCLSSALNIDEIWATSTEQHISRCSNHKRRNEFKMNYDQYWEEFGGIKSNEQHYNLPIAYQPKELAEIKSNKRAMYHRRFAMLNQLEGELMVNMLKLHV